MSGKAEENCAVKPSATGRSVAEIREESMDKTRQKLGFTPEMKRKETYWPPSVLAKKKMKASWEEKKTPVQLFVEQNNASSKGESLYDFSTDSPRRHQSNESLSSPSSLWPGCLFDSHCHLDLVYRRLATEGQATSCIEQTLAWDGQEVHQLTMAGLVTNWCFPKSWPRQEELLAKGERVHYSVGCHPKQADQLTPANLARLENLVRGRGVVALGECGLDYSERSTVGREVQALAFLSQLKLALKYNLPLIVHAREAEDDLYRLLGQCCLPKDWSIHRHCFTGDWGAALRWLTTYPASKIGLTALVTFPSATQVHRVALLTPLSRLLLETDAPYFPPRSRVMMPQQYSFPFSQPGHVLQVAAEVARIKDRSLEEVLRANLRNVTEIYGIKTNYAMSPTVIK